MRRVLVAALVCASAHAWAFGDADKLSIGQIAYQGNWNPRPSAARRLAWEIDKRTSIETATEPAEVRLSDETQLRRHALLLLAGDAAFPQPGEEDLGRLRRHLQAGGILIVDSADARPGGG